MFDNLFYNWEVRHWGFFIIFLLIILYPIWFFGIPSAMGDSVGVSFTTKVGMTVGVPLIIYYFINKKV